jgi:Xaa-Pro aminopeptidase
MISGPAPDPKSLPSVFAARRLRLLERLGGGTVILRSNPEQTRSNDTEFPFRQDSDFHYLTGFDEPNAVAVITDAHAEHRFVLFVRARDPEKETWNGRRAGVEGAVKTYGADAAFDVAELDAKLPGYLDGGKTLYFTPGLDAGFNARMEGWLETSRRSRPKTGKGALVRTEVGALTHPMRLVKEPGEVDLLARACAITAEAHVAAMKHTRPGMNEAEVEAIVNYVFRAKGGGAMPGYNSIVAGGENATILHYTENNMPLADGTLLLIDAGAESAMYTSDLTRTFPVGARFTPAQRAVYEIVLAAQKAAIAVVRPGTRFSDVHETALHVLVEGLIRLGVLEGTVEENEAKNLYRPFYMHRTSHWLGLDVHDVGSYVDDAGGSRPLEPGMVLTVEPGLYFGDTTAPYDAKYRGIGVRIEDDVLVTAKGSEVLTAGAPKEVEEIEALRASGLKTPPAPLPVA